MSRSFAEGSLTGEADPAAALYALVATDLTANSYWSLVETYNDGSYDYHVWKNDGVLNGEKDFHVIFGVRTSTVDPTLFVVACEDYDSTTHKMRRTCPQGYNTGNAVPDASDFSFNPGTWYDVSVTQYYAMDVWVDTDVTAFDYIYSVHDTHVVVGTAVGAAEYGLFAGFYESLLPAAIVDLPLAVFQLNGTTESGSTMRFSNPGAYSRFPHVTVESDYYTWKGTGPFTGDEWYSVWTAYNEPIGEGDAFLNGDVWASRAMCSAAGQVGGGSAVDTYGGIKGLLPEWLVVINSPASVSFRDTITIDGQVYAHMCLDGWISKEVIA